MTLEEYYNSAPTLSSGDDDFDKWMAEVDGVLEAHVSLSSDELPDWSWRDEYDNGTEPAEAAEQCLRDNGWEG